MKERVYKRQHTFQCNDDGLLLQLKEQDTIGRTYISDSGETSIIQRHTKYVKTGRKTPQNKYKMQPKTATDARKKHSRN